MTTGLFNLIVYNRKGARSSFLQDIMHTVLERLPCRVFFIEECENNLLESETLIKTCGGKGSPIGCDTIKIRAGGSYLKRVPFIIFPKLLSELPVYLMWGQDPSSDKTIFPAFTPFADRVIFDSECSSCLPKFNDLLLEQSSAYSFDLIDMNWVRISGWRKMIAQTFNTQERLEQLATIKQVEIIYNSRANETVQHCNIEALYLQGWLSARLSKKTIKIVLTPKDTPNLSPGAILGTYFTTEDNTQYRFTRKSISYEVTVEIESPKKCEIPYTLMLSHLKRSQFFIKEVFYEPMSEHYQQTIQFLSQNLTTDHIVPGDKEATLHYCVEHWIKTANEAIDDHGFFTVALSGGSTPKAIYERLALPENAKKVNWKKVHLFWSDERAVLADHPDSNYRMAMDAGLKDLPIPKEQIHRMKAEKDIEQNAKEYEMKIQQVAPSASLDLIMLGMGDDGHTASLFPGTEALKVNDRLVVANYIPQKSCWRMTFTFKMINTAKTIVFYVLGKQKVERTKEVFKHPKKYPAGLVGTKQSPALWILYQ